jgi:hypothetical protein
MSAAKAKFTVIWERPAAPQPRKLDLELLGAGVRHLPPAYWEPEMFFHGAADLALREHTGGFPTTLRKDQFTHPLFVPQTLPGLGHQVCPCSSKNFGVRRFIRAGCRLLYTNRQTDRNSYLVDFYRFNLPLEPAFSESLRFMGRVPLDCLECREP